jgi:hypothetical protein
MKMDTCKPNPNESYAIKYQKHETLGFCYYIKYIHGHYKEPVIYRGPDAHRKFIEYIKKEIEEIGNKYDEIESMAPLTEQEKYDYTKCKEPKLCKTPFSKENKVLDKYLIYF